VITLSVSGANAVAQKFARAAAASARGAPDGLDKAALLVTRSAKMRAPVDTGFLKGAILPHRISPFEAQVISHAEYGIYPEFGTRKMRAQPHMRPALDANRAEIQRLVGSDVMANVAAALGSGVIAPASVLGAGSRVGGSFGGGTYR